MAEATQDLSRPGSRDLLDLLLTIERRCREQSVGLPQQETPPEIWEGFIFSLAGYFLLTPLAEIKEILNYPPEVTAVPGTKSWVCGIANNRGSLLPIFDLEAFLFGTTAEKTRRSRVLVIPQEDSAAGLLVGESVGIRQFSAKDGSVKPGAFAKSLRPFIVAGFKGEGGRWPVVSLRTMAGHPDLQRAVS